MKKILLNAIGYSLLSGLLISCISIQTTTTKHLENDTKITKCAFEALGGEKGNYVSHANNRMWLQNGIQGEGEYFIIENRPNGRVALAATGGEKGKYLSHAFKKLWLQNGVQGEGEEWVMINKGSNKVAFECLGGETGLFLSHAFNKMWLQNGYQGEGELWRKVCK